MPVGLDEVSFLQQQHQAHLRAQARGIDDDEDEDEDEEMLSSGILKDKEKIAGIEDEGEKTEIESEVDMDGENDKAEGETNNDDKLLDNISLESEATRERLNSKLAER